MTTNPTLPLFQVDAFTNSPFAGNPAAVMPLMDCAEWPSAELMQAIASENNLAETAFFRPATDRDDADFHLRWFTPAIEVPICGHATLASGHVLRNHLGFEQERITFACKAGLVSVESGEEGRLTLDFPSIPPAAREQGGPPPGPPHDLIEAIGSTPPEPVLYANLVGENTPIAIFEKEAEVRALAPDLAKLTPIDEGLLVATAPGDESGVDFVSRFFAPGGGIPEDPVTGSTHCALAPLWAQRLGKTTLQAKQISQRTGDLLLELVGDRVRISGHCVTVIEGQLVAQVSDLCGAKS